MIDLSKDDAIVAAGELLSALRVLRGWETLRDMADQVEIDAARELMRNKDASREELLGRVQGARDLIANAEEIIDRAEAIKALRRAGESAAQLVQLGGGSLAGMP